MVRDDLLLRAQLDDFMKSCFGFSWSLSRFKWNFTIILQHDVISVVCRGIAWFHSLPFLVTGPAAALAGKGVSGWADFDLRRRLTGHPFPSFAKSFHAEIRTICEFGMPQVSSRKYMPVEHVVKYLLILRLWCFDSEIKVDTQMATVSGRLLPTPLLKDGHDLRCWFQKTPMRFSKLPLLKTATRQFIWSASQLLQLIRSSEPTELRGTETIQWPFIIYFFEKFINSSKFTINSFSFFLKYKHLSLILSFVVFWSLFFRCLGVYGASLKNSKSFLAICNANLQTPHVGLCWRTRWDDIETHWMHHEIHSSLHKTTCKWKWIKINCMTHRSLETNELPEEWCQLVGGTVCAEVQYEENQIFAAKSGGMAAGGGKIVHWHAEMTWRVSHFWENMLEQTCWNLNKDDISYTPCLLLKLFLLAFDQSFGAYYEGILAERAGNSGIKG